MIKSVNNYPISQLFDTNSRIVYSIPRYQREYTWGKKDWENLFDDVFENDPGYFLGSIICINQSTDALSVQKLEVIDGQQRLTTLSLLFASVYGYLKRRESQLTDKNKAKLFALMWRLVLEDDDQIRVIPQIQNNNQNDYRAVLAEVGILDACDVPANAGNRRLFRAFRYFQSRLATMTDGIGNQVTVILDILDKVNQACLVKIEVSSHADAYTLFESLNNRGTPLTAVDLIKNKLLAKLESIEPGKIDNYFHRWNKLLEYLGDDYGIQERFFRHYYNAFKEELKTVYYVPMATRSNLIQIYEKLINHDAKGCLEKISNAGRLYALMLSRNQDEALNKLQKPLKDLDRIQGAPSYLLMLYLLARMDQLQLSSDHLAQIVRLLVRFFVRRNLTDIPPTRDLNRIFMTIIDKLSGLAEAELVNMIRGILVGHSADDTAFRNKLEGPIYEENVGVTRFVLCALAEQGMTRETLVNLWRLEGKQFVWTIEHIFPQGDNIPDVWVDMIADGDKQQAIDYQQSHVHKLGNLTLSGFNSKLGNKSFEEKRDRKDADGRHVGYRNGLILNKDLASITSWSIEQIDTRTEKLVDQVVDLFSMDGNL